MKRIKLFLGSMLTLALATAASLTAFANDTGGNMNIAQELGTAFSGIQSDLLAVIAVVLPVGLAIFGTFIGLKKGISFVRSLINKAG